MAVKIIRSTDILIQMYNYYLPDISLDNFISKLETYGYELDINNNNIHGIFKAENIISLIILTTKLILDLNPVLKPKIYFVDIISESNIINFLLNKYIYSVQDINVELTNKNKIFVNDFIVKEAKIKKFTETKISQYVIDFMHEIDNINKLCNKNKEYRNFTSVNSNIHRLYRNSLINLYAKEILTHPIIDNNIKDSNKLKHKYLSHSYLRKEIYESFIYDYKEYKDYNFVFEISDCFCMKDYKTYKHLFIGLNKQHYFSIMDVMLFIGISNRTILHNNCLYYVYSNCRKIGKFMKHQKHNCIEINLDILLPKNVVNNKNNIYDFNVYNLTNSDLLLIYLLSIRIDLIKIIDIYNNKYTIRIYSCLNYNSILNILSRVFLNRLII